MFENIPFTYSLYAVPPIMSGVEVLFFGAALGIFVVVLMLLSAGWKAHKKSKPSPQKTVNNIRSARIGCVVDFGQILSQLETRQINLRRDRRELDAITIQCSAERGDVEFSPHFDALITAEDRFVDSYKWTESMLAEIYKRIGTLDRLITIGEELEKRLVEWDNQDAKVDKPMTPQSFDRKMEVVHINLQKEIKALRDLKESVQKDCNEATTFLLTIKQPVHLQINEADGEGAGARWIKARHSGVLHRLRPKAEK